MPGLPDKSDSKSDDTLTITISCDNPISCGASVAHNASTLLGTLPWRKRSTFVSHLPLTDLLFQTAGQADAIAPRIGAKL